MIPRFRLLLLSVVFLLIGNTADLIAQKRKPVRKTVAPAKTVVPASPESAAEAKRRIEAFQKAWATINQYYFDRTFNGLDWGKIRLEYEPKVRAARTDAELHRLLSEMISRLGRSHLAIIPPEVYRAIESAKVEARVREARRSAKEAKDDGKEDETEPSTPEEDPLAQFGIGVDLRILNGQFVITRVDGGSTAEKGGIRPGFVLDRVNSVSLGTLLQRLESAGAASPPMKRQLIYQVITGFLNGEKDTEVAVTILDENNTHREISLKREKLPLQVISLMTGLPERHLNFEKRSVAEDVGYIHFDYFAVPVIDQFCAAIGEFKEKKGLIVDLRGNFGGLLATMPTFAGMLSDEKIDLGTSMFRTSSERLMSWPKVKHFKGKIAFLIDSHSTSAAEIFAAAMQESGRAFVVGGRSPGEALPSVAVELPTGAVLQYPIANFKTSTGKFIEGTGVIPDHPVPLTRAALLQGKDPQLEKAIELLHGNEKPTKREVVASTQQAPEFLAQITSSAGPPPPPVPVKPTTINTPQKFSARPSSKVASSNVIDPLAKRLLDEFLLKIGGREAVASINSYELKGETELQVKGTKNELDVEIVRDGPTKYAEILSSPSAGEIREIHNGKTITVQSDYGLTQEIPKFTDVVDTDILGPIRSIAKPDYFVSLKYQGAFDREGVKVHLVDGRSKEGMMIALAFDVSSGLLLNFTGSYYGMNFADYEKAGDLVLPHIIERERLMTVTLDEITINKPIDQSKFAKREKCYDREN